MLNDSSKRLISNEGSANFGTILILARNNKGISSK
jgi:hypothetical protein